MYQKELFCANLIWPDLGVALGLSGQHALAIEAYKNGVRLRPNEADAQYALGAAYSASKFYAEAAEVFKHAVVFKQDHTGAHFNLGVTYLILGNRQAAMEEYNTLKTIDSDAARELLNQINKQ